MAVHWMVFRSGKFAMQLVGANIRRVLVAHEAGIECFVGNRKRVFARLSGTFANRKGIFPDEILGLQNRQIAR